MVGEVAWRKPAGEGGSRAALLGEYLVADDELVIVSVADGKTKRDMAAKVVRLKRRGLDDKVEQATKAAVLRDVVEWRKKAVPIATVLLDPIAARLRDRDRLVIVPDDLLWKLPFEALPAGETDLSSQARVTYATSLATLTVQRSAAAAAAPSDHLRAGIAGAPAIPAAIRAQVALTSQGWKEPDADASLAAATEIAKAYGDAATL